MQNKIEKVEKIEQKFRNIMRTADKKNDVELMLETIEAYAYFLSNWNQRYVDSFLEDKLSEIVKKVGCESQDFSHNKNTVLFFDGVGNDMRGLMSIYIKGLLDNGYHVVYVVGETAKDKQPFMKDMVQGRDIEFVYYKEIHISRIDLSDAIVNIVYKYAPQSVFIYIKSVDVAASLAFERLEGKVLRYYITLTDHAFYLGCRSADYFIEFRDYGANNSMKHRKISRDKLIKLPYYPIINREQEFEGFPFDPINKKIVFSGGSISKTIGEDGAFYQFISRLLAYREDVYFLYAAQIYSGDISYLEELMKQYPNRVYRVDERKDLFQLLKRVDLYMNTYPIGGGQMCQYAAIAGTYPLMLYQDEMDGILLNAREKGLMYNNLEEMYVDAVRLLEDMEYRKEKTKLLKESVISEYEFGRQLEKLIQEEKTDYKISIIDFNDSDTLKTYFDTCDIRENLLHSIKRDEVKNVLRFFPLQFLKKKIETAIILFKMICANKRKS